MLTKRRKEVLDFMKTYLKKNGYSPSLQEIQKKLKLASVSTAHFHVSKLRDGGYITKQSGKARSIETNSIGTMVRIPLLGYISAGQPIEAVENREMIAVPANRVPHTASLFALTVRGDSMIGENIYDGDVIVAAQQNTAKDGETVVALIDNEFATVKKIYRERRQIRLQPANDSFEPIIIKRNQDFKIQGVVVDVIKHTREGQLEDVITHVERHDEKKLPLNKIILGDAVQELKKLPSESCDIIIIDPPYNIGKDFGNNIDKREIGEYIAWCKSWINESVRILKPTGTMFIYGFSEILAHLSVEVPIQKRWLIWHYTNKNMASLNFWQRSHEAIICAWKDKPLFNRDEVREPYTESFLNGAAGKVRKGTLGRFSKNGKETVYKAHEGGALPRDVIKIPALAGGAGMIERWFLCKTCDEVCEPRQLQKHDGHEIMKHPTQKPLEITRRLLKSCLPKKDGTVLVPFAGTGSECVVARELDANYFGIEINPDYVKLANGFLGKY